MSDDVENTTDQGGGVRGSRNDALLLALGETRAAAKQAADTSARIETAVTGLATRVGALEVDVATVKATQAAQAQADRDRVAETGPRTSMATWISLAFTALLALYVILDHTPTP